MNDLEKYLATFSDIALIEKLFEVGMLLADKMALEMALPFASDQIGTDISDLLCTYGALLGEVINRGQYAYYIAVRNGEMPLTGTDD